MRTSIMRFLAYLQIQFQMVFLRLRWLLPIPVMGVIGYMMIHYLQKYQLPTFLTQAGAVSPVNSWDAFFIAFGNAHYMTFVIANLFLILVCDMLPEPNFGQLSLVRLRSRYAWWSSKALTMLAAALVYTVLCAFVLLGTASIALPFSFEWSSWTTGFPANALLPNFVVHQMSLPAAAAILLWLVILGLWALGLLTQIITILTQRFLYGYFAGLLALLGSYAVCGSLVNVPNVLKLLPVQRNLILTLYPYPIRELPLGWSFLYWGIWLGALLLAGYVLSKRQNYLAQRH